MLEPKRLSADAAIIRYKQSIGRHSWRSTEEQWPANRIDSIGTFAAVECHNRWRAEKFGNKLIRWLAVYGFVRSEACTQSNHYLCCTRIISPNKKEREKKTHHQFNLYISPSWMRWRVSKSSTSTLLLQFILAFYCSSQKRSTPETHSRTQFSIFK